MCEGDNNFMVTRKPKINKASEQVLEFVKADQLGSDVTYRFWDTNMEEMYDISTIEYGHYGSPKGFTVKSADKDIIKAAGDGILIPSTHLYDVADEEIYMGDIVTCSFLDDVYKDRVVFWDNGWRVIGCTTQEFKMYANRFTVVVGNIWENPELYEPYLRNYDAVIK